MRSTPFSRLDSDPIRILEPRQVDPNPGAARPGFMVTTCNYLGTLAAVRNLGRDGIPVHVAESERLARASWSKWVINRSTCPSPFDGGRAFIDRLVEIGKVDPGNVLYPSSDDTAFLFALHAQELAQDFVLHQPPVAVVYDLLNKNRLYSLARAVGLETPDWWLAEGPQDLPASVKYPLVLKPQTQVQFRSKSKGAMIREASEARDAFARFQEASRFGKEVTDYDPEVERPLAQRYHPEAAEAILSLAGFVTAEGNSAVRASIKVLQRPRRLGVGVCFEATSVPPELAERTLELCRRAGYFGVFEVEFIVADGRAMLIDFNPRFYGEMAFEVARGLPMARLVYEAALGNAAWVRDTLDASSAMVPSRPTAYCHRLAFELLLGVPLGKGRMSAVDRRKWRAWYASRDGAILDPIRAPDDRLPGFADLAQEFLSAVRHPRAFLRSLVDDAPAVGSGSLPPIERAAPDDGPYDRVA